QGRPRVLVDEGLLDGGFLRLEAGDDLHEPLVDLAQAIGEVHLRVGGDEAAGDVGKPTSVRLHDPPAGAPQPRGDADNANHSLLPARLIAGRTRAGVFDGVCRWGSRQSRVLSKEAATAALHLAPPCAMPASF